VIVTGPGAGNGGVAGTVEHAQVLHPAPGFGDVGFGQTLLLHDAGEPVVGAPLCLFEGL